MNTEAPSVRDGQVVETTNLRPSFLRRLWTAQPVGYNALAIIMAFWDVNKVTPDITFTTTLVSSPEQTYERVKSGLLAVCRTRVLSHYPSPISAHCYYDDFGGGFGSSLYGPLDLKIDVAAEGGSRSRISVLCPSDRNMSAETHELRRREVRRLLEWVVAEH